MFNSKSIVTSYALGPLHECMNPDETKQSSVVSINREGGANMNPNLLKSSL